MSKTSLQRHPILLDLLRQLPHRGELHPALTVEPFLRDVLPGLQSNLFTGFTFVQRAGQPSGVLAFHKGLLIYGRLNIEEQELDVPAEFAKASSETTFVSVRMMRHVMRAGFALIDGRQIGLWPHSDPALVAQAVQKFTATSLGVLAWIGAEPRLCIYEHGQLMRESPQADATRPGPLLQYEALDDLPEGLDLLDLLAALGRSQRTEFAPPATDAVEADLEQFSAVQVAPVKPIPAAAIEVPPQTAPDPSADLSAAWTLLDSMFTKKLGRAAASALATLRANIGELPAETQLQQMKTALESNFGPKAVSYFEQHLGDLV